MKPSLPSIRPTAIVAWRFGALLVLLAPAGFAAVTSNPMQGFYSLTTLILIAGACAALVAGAALFILAKKNRTLEAVQDEVKLLRSELEAIAITDPLTGLFNRRYMEAQFKMALSYARRQRRPLSIALADVDFFKSINDEHGRQRGDLVLKGVATTVQGVLRDEDIACRYGSKKFMLILPSTDLAGATICAERLRSLVESKGLSGLKVTVSIGVVSTDSHPDFSAESLIEWAHKALYAAKQRGRNLVVSEADDIGTLQVPHKYGKSSTYIH